MSAAKPIHPVREAPVGFASLNPPYVLRGLFSEWKDRWWPQPMPHQERAEVPAFQSPLAAE